MPKLSTLSPTLRPLPPRLGAPIGDTKARDQLRYQQQPWRAWYNTAEWQRIRDRQLDREPLCRMCAASGVTTVATVCDHVEPHRGDRQKFLRGPFQSLCAPHHSGAKQREEREAQRTIGDRHD